MNEEKITNIPEILASLLADRNIFLYGAITQERCLLAQTQLLYMNGLDDKKEINLYVSGPGGVIDITDRDCYINAQTALLQGLCDKILKSPKIKNIKK